MKNIKYLGQRPISLWLKIIKGRKLEIPVRDGQGYTLIELLTVIALFAIIGSISISMIAYTLRGSKKSDATENVRQNGDLILLRMVRAIRFAKSIDVPACIPSSNSSSLAVTSLTGKQTTFSCPSTSQSITENNLPLTDPAIVSVQSCSFVCRQATSVDIPTVTIQFSLTQGAAGLLENKVSIPFQATVNMRNIN